MFTNFLLLVIAATLVWALVARDLVDAWRAGQKAARRAETLIPVAPAAPVVHRDESLVLLLRDATGVVEHEVTKQGISEYPQTYSYGGKTYTYQLADGQWEYRR